MQPPPIRQALYPRCLLAVCSTAFVLAFAAATPSAQQPVKPVKPNYELAADWTAQRVGRLVFDTSVTPRWLETNPDKFWYAYQTREGRKFWMVDALKKAKAPLFDHAKMARS